MRTEFPGNPVTRISKNHIGIILGSIVEMELNEEQDSWPGL